ncbi:hypothetical protein NNRS527_01671 [Nitrosospira sp. NRS527]|nr:hypothetical protein NNRS527_01671 [Nitrosospira sp. NRS527]
MYSLPHVICAVVHVVQKYCKFEPGDRPVIAVRRIINCKVTTAHPWEDSAIKERGGIHGQSFSIGTGETASSRGFTGRDIEPIYCSRALDFNDTFQGKVVGRNSCEAAGVDLQFCEAATWMHPKPIEGHEGLARRVGRDVGRG